MFDLVSMQDATQNCRFPEKVLEPLRLELNFIFPLEYATDSLYWWSKDLSLQLKISVMLRGKSETDKSSLQQIVNFIPRLKYRYRVSFPSDYKPTLDNDTFEDINTQPSNMQGENWIRNAKSCKYGNLQTLLVVKSTVSSSSSMNR